MSQAEPTISDRLRLLLLRSEEPDFSVAEEAELARLLTGSGEARRALIRHNLVSGEMIERLRGRPRATSPRPVTRRPRRARPLAIAAACVAVATVAMAFTGWLGSRATRGKAERAEQPIGVGVPMGRPPRIETVPPDEIAVTPPMVPITEIDAAADYVTEFALLRRAPRTLLDRLAKRAYGRLARATAVDARPCKDQPWEALDLVVVGAALGDAALVSDGFRVVPGAFEPPASVGSLRARVLCAVHWLAHGSHAALVLRQSQLAASEAARINALAARIERTTHWLATAAARRELPSSPSMPNDAITAAAAFALAGELVDEDSFRHDGAAMMKAALADQRADGVLLVGRARGHDSGLQAQALWRLAWYTLAVNDPAARAAYVRGTAWLAARLSPAGAVDVTDNVITGGCRPGRDPDCPGPRAHEIAWALLYDGLARTPGYLEMAERVFKTPAP